jgi:hypothetical protein
VTVHTNLNVTGKPAQFGRGVMTEVGGKLIGIFADNLAAMLAAGPAGAVEEAEEDEEAVSAGNEAEPAAAASDEALPIDVLNLPIRAWNSLRRDGIQTLGDLAARTPEQLLAIGNIGPASVAEISSRLADRGLALAGSEAAAADSAAGQGSAAGEDTSAGPAKAADAVAAATRKPAGDGAAASDGQGAARKAAANGGGPAQAAAPPREPVSWQPQDEAIDLLGVAGLPVLKRVLPAAAGLLALILVFLGVRRRRARRG